MVAVNLEEEVIPVYLKDVEDEHGKIRTRLVNIDKEVVRQTLAEIFTTLLLRIALWRVNGWPIRNRSSMREY